MDSQKAYYYEGPVEQFGKCICRMWNGWTSAPSRRKALSNLEYQFKKEHGYMPASLVKLNDKNLEELR